MFRCVLYYNYKRDRELAVSENQPRHDTQAVRLRFPSISSQVMVGVVGGIGYSGSSPGCEKNYKKSLTKLLNYDIIKTRKRKREVNKMAVNFEKKERKAAKRINIGKKYQIVWYALPIGLLLIPFCEVTDLIRNRDTWSEKKAKKTLDKNLCNVLDYNKEEKTYNYCVDWQSFGLAYKAPFYYKNWMKKYSRKLHQYLINTYEAEGYTKKIEIDDYGTKWIVFKKVF